MARASSDPTAPCHRAARRASALALLAPLLLVACAQTPASPAPDASTDGRMAVIRGTTSGITIIPARTPRPASATPSAPGASPEAAAPAAGASGATTRWLGELIDSLPPPTGRPLVQQKKLDAPDQGIALPTAGTGSGGPR